jgi:SAM-dependent methyltransferase
MDRILYDRMAEHDTRHWWYRARRKVLSALIGRRISLPRDAKILEIGCGTGHNLAMLEAFGTVDAIEVDPATRVLAEARLGRAVGSAPLPMLTGVPDDHYDLIALLDVLEHIEDDLAALQAIGERLKPSGAILLTVPAHPWMWSGHDVANHHYRRYTKKTLRTVLERAGFKIEVFSPLNALLFPAAIIQRFIAQISNKEGSDDAMPPRLINISFEAIFGLEAHVVGRLPLPPGLSLVAIASMA